MINNLRKKPSFKLTILLIIGLIIVVANSNAINIEKLSNRNFDISKNQGYIDISSQEAWELLSSTSNGIQFPIDVRTYNEWINERIDTPYPEFARLYILSDLKNENGINHFKSVYTNKEVIIYCASGGRSASAAQYLVLNEFNGTIYNMIGGISSWKQSGLPVKNNNQIPSKPEIPDGSTICFSNISSYFKTNSIDPDDDVIRYGWDWNGDDTIDEWTDYLKSGETVNISHKWSLLKNYDIKVLAEDIVGGKSDYSSKLTINVSNLAPNMPEISGTTLGKNGKTYSYNISSIDQNGDEVYFYILWYDNYPDPSWKGPYLSNEKILRNYSWADEGIYNIKVKAKDIHGDESEWTNLEVTMPNNKNSYIKKFINPQSTKQIFLLKIFHKLI